MTFEEYISNPLGKQNSVLNSATREGMRALYTNKFDNILLRENNKIEYYLFKDREHNIYWAYFKIPSEEVKKFYYDVVIKFSATQKTLGGGSNLFKYDVQFYSNDPAFVFTYAYVFNKEKMFIKELTKKMSREALTKKPREKNSKELVGYVKSLYFAYLLMQNRSLNKKSRFEAETIPYQHLVTYMKKIVPADAKVADRQERGKGISHKKKIQLSQRDAEKMQRMTGKKLDDRFMVKSTKKLGKVSNSAIVQKRQSKFGVKKSKRI